MADGSVWTNLVASKARIVPAFGTSTPRVELEGATLATRVTFRVVHALLEDPSGVVYFLGDSETILACRERDKGFFGEFFGNRIGEMYDNEYRIRIAAGDIRIEWHHVKSKDNAADRVTRLETLPSDLCLGSEWLDGPSFLRLPVEQWPVDRNFADRKGGARIPMEEIRKQYRDQLH